MKVITVIQARTSSSRLRNKVLLSFNKNTLLGQVINAVKSAKEVDEIWVATSINKEDDIIELICKENKVYCFRGSLTDVRSRFNLIAKKTNADIIVRVTADNPFTEASYISQLIAYIKAHADIDYVCMDKSMILDGTGSEVFTSESLKQSVEMSNDERDIEHVTQFILKNDLFKKEYLKPNNIDFLAKNPYFLGVDTLEDYVRNINILLRYSATNTLKKIILNINNNEEIV